jgi:hypothetical protein
MGEIGIIEMVQTTENREKIGAQVNESVYAEFKEHVYEKTGQKRGVLGEAVEAALRQYMEDTESDSDDDVSNKDLMREIRALRSDEQNPTPHTPPEKDESNAYSAGSPESGGASGASSPAEETPAPPPGEDKGTLAGEKSGESEKPPMNVAPGKRAAWLASEIDIHGRVPFDTLVTEVGREYPEHSDSKRRELAWRWAAIRAPTREDFPDASEYSGDTHLDFPSKDAKLRSRAEAENSPGLLRCPRRHDNGAWFQIAEARSDAALNHQEPTERGKIEVYLGAGGARQCAKDVGLLGSDDEDEWGTGDLRSRLDGDSDESDESTESDGVSSEGFDGVDIDGATDESGESGEAAEDADERFDELDGADRGRE